MRASRVGGGNLNADAGDLAVTAGWGHAGQGGVTMPGKGKSIFRPYPSEELAAIGQGTEALGLSTEEALAQLGDQAVDVYLSGVAYWRCVPSGGVELHQDAVLGLPISLPKRQPCVYGKLAFWAAIE